MMRMQVSLEDRAKVGQVFWATNWVTLVFKLTHAKDGQSLTLVQAIVAIYQCFQFLLLVTQYPDISLVPSKEIDYVLHILEQNHLFNRYFDHQPGLGTRGEADRLIWLQAFQTTRDLFEHHFGLASMSNAQPACCQIAERHKLNGMCKVQPSSCEICLKVGRLAA